MKLSKLYLALCCGVSTVAMAEADQPTEQLDEISVIALRDASAFAKYAYQTAVVNQETLTTKQPTSVANALKSLPNVDVQGGSRAINQKPIIRGLTGNRVVQIVDGVRQNFDLAHRGSYLTPTNLIQEIEVIKGPSSTLWGSGALGGTVIMRTPNALDLLEDGQSIGAKIEQGYQSANSLWSSTAAVYGATKQFDWLVQGYYNDADDLRTGSGEDLDHSAYRQKGGLVKFGWQINDAHRVELSHRHTQTKLTAPSNNELLSSHRKAILSRQSIADQSSVLNYYFNPENPYINSQFTIYHNVTTEKETRFKDGNKDLTKSKTTGFNLRNSSNFTWLNLTYGADLYQERGEIQRETNSITPYRPSPYNAKSQVAGLYLLGHIPLGERVILSPSIRYDHFKNQNDDTVYRSHHWSPSLAFTFKPTNWLDLIAKYSEAFRAPSIEERFANGTHFSAGLFQNTFVANPNLRPEIAKNKEASANFHFDNVFANQDKLSFTATYFQNDVKDLINLVKYSSGTLYPVPVRPGVTIPMPLPDRSQYQNIANARLRGFELETQYQIDRLTFGVAYAQTRGIDKDSKKALANIAANKATFAVNYEVVKDTFNVGANVSRYSPQRRVPADYNSYDGYTLTNLTASYAPKAGALKNLSVNVAVDNLFDRKNLPAFALMEDAGRNVKVSVGYKF